MSSSQSQASEQAMQTNRQLAEGYYGIALPGLEARQGAINQQLAQGEPQYLKDAYGAQRTGLTEGLSAQGGAAQAQQAAGAKKALSGGNFSSQMNPADIGAQLANALYGSKFAEGQANLNQQFNLVSMGLGGAGTTGNAALNASGQQLNAIGMLPNYNTTYANILGGASGLASIYGAANKAGLFSNPYATAIGPGGYASQPGWQGFSGTMGT